MTAIGDGDEVDAREKTKSDSCCNPEKQHATRQGGYDAIFAVVLFRREKLGAADGLAMRRDHA